MKSLRTLVWQVSFVADFLILNSANAQHKWNLKYAPAACDNPLKGLVPYVQPSKNSFPHSMEFNYIKYSELVKGPDTFDWQPLEDLLNDVKSRGNQTIFRVYLEYPGHKNVIPKFLLDNGLETTQWKDTDSKSEDLVITPNYKNKDLRASLQSWIAALGKKYDGDPRIAYITAGLLGKWGEWHNYPRDDLWAPQAVQTEVLKAYDIAFNKTPILLRYPANQDHNSQASNVKFDFGYHDDSFAFATLHTGKKEESWFFQTILKEAKAQQKWKTNPIGGEVRPEVWGCCHDPEPCTKSSQSFAKCRDELHVTWLMESGLFEKKPSAQRWKQAMVDVRKMGYEFHVESVSASPQGPQWKLSATIKNTGIAPFYHQGWTVRLLPKSANQQKPYDLKWQLTGLLPGKSKTFTAIVKTDLTKGFELGVPNPMSGGKPLQFANQSINQRGWLNVK